MKKFLCLFILAISFTSWTQITITEADFAAGGDTARISMSNETSLDLITTGSNASWDFSMISIDEQKIDTFYDISEAETFYQYVFNNQFSNADYASEYFRPWMAGVDFSQGAAFGLEIEDPVVFTKKGSSKIEIPGFGLKINGFPVPAPSDTIDVQYELPFTFSDGWTSFSYTNLDMNPQFDAIYRRHQQRYAIVDGWGQITTPFKTYDVVRVKTLIQSQDSVYVNFGGFGGQWFELPTPEQIEYNWIANNEKVSVFKVVTQDFGGGHEVSSVEFKDKKRDFASLTHNSLEIGVYPNPASNQLQIQSPEQMDQIEIHDMNGKLVYSTYPSTNLIQLDVSNWESGLYVLKVLHNSDISISKFQVR